MVDITFLEALLQLFDKYAVSIVMLSITIIFIGVLMKYFLKLLKDQQKTIKDYMNSLNQKPHISESSLTSYANNANEIYSILHNYLNLIGANRISIYEYHNGGVNICGVEFKKCSLNYEAVDSKTSRIGQEQQQLPLSINPLWNKLIIKDGPILIEDLEDIKKSDNMIYLTLKENNIKSKYLKQLKTFDNKLIGFISIIYYDKPRKLSLDEQKQLNRIGFQIANLINK